MTFNIRTGGHKHYPVIFAKKNWANAAYGTTVSDGGGTPTISSSYPLDNLIDGNRSSFTQIEKATQRYGDMQKIRFDLSGANFGSDSNNSIDTIVIHNDPMYPCSRIRILSFTANDYSTGELVHRINTSQYTAGLYFKGSGPRIDGLPGMPPYENDVFGTSGWRALPMLHGTHVYIQLNDVIDSTREYVEIQVLTGGRNLFGISGTFDEGLWDNAWTDSTRTVRHADSDETLETSDPYSSHQGSNNNYIKLTTSGASGDVQTNWQDFKLPIDYNNIKGKAQTYLLKWAEKCTGVYGVGPDFAGYTVELSLGPSRSTTGIIHGNSGVHNLGSWGNNYLFINQNIGGTWTSGIGPTRGNSSQQYLDTPYDINNIGIKFVLKYNASFPLTWQIDDVTLYSIGLPVENMSDMRVESAQKDGVYYPVSFPDHWDMTGNVRLRRIGLLQSDLVVSAEKDRASEWQDWGGGLGIITGYSEGETGKAVSANIHGNIRSTFISKSGLKRSRSVDFVCDKKFKEYIDSLAERTEPFTIIEPNGEWGEYVITNLSGKTTENFSGNYYDKNNLTWLGDQLFTITAEMREA